MNMDDIIELTVKINGEEYKCESYNMNAIYSMNERECDKNTCDDLIRRMSNSLSNIFIYNKSAIVIVAEGLVKQ